jgi:hypothetical protein
LHDKLKRALPCAAWEKKQPLPSKRALPPLASNRRLSKKILDFRIQVPSDGQNVTVFVANQKASHLVVRQMHAIWPLIHKNCDWGVRSGVGNMLCHFFHDERIAGMPGVTNTSKLSGMSRVLTSVITLFVDLPFAIFVLTSVNLRLLFLPYCPPGLPLRASALSNDLDLSTVMNFPPSLMNSL